MTLHLYDTSSKSKRLFEPIDSSNIRMYVCGPTVYDYPHVGNARPIIVFDIKSKNGLVDIVNAVPTGTTVS